MRSTCKLKLSFNTQACFYPECSESQAKLKTQDFRILTEMEKRDQVNYLLH